MLGIFFKKALQGRFFFFWNTVNHREIVLFYFAGFYFIAQHAERSGVFCRYYYSAGVPVNAVRKCGAEAVFIIGAVFAFFVKVALYPRYESISVFVFVRVD